jgi:hypothetical protein
MNRSKFVQRAALVATALAHPDVAVSDMPADPNVCHGYDDDEVEGDVMGMQVVGYDDDGEPIVTGARRRRGGMVRVRRPSWRDSQLAPGVIAPDQGLLPLPLTGITGNSFDTSLGTASQITFQGQIQKPFRGERLLVSTVRTGASAVGRLLSQLFVGTDLQQLDIGGFDAEQVGTPTAFGVRLTMKPAQPGVFIRLVTQLTTPVSGTDTILATVTLLGRLVH